MGLWSLVFLAVLVSSAPCCAEESGRWPRFTERALAERSFLTVHVPKAAGSTLIAATKLTHCQHLQLAELQNKDNEKCRSEICDVYFETHSPPLFGTSDKEPVTSTAKVSMSARADARCGSPRDGHDPRLITCASAHGLDALFADVDRWKPGAGYRPCVAALRDPWSRVVSAWFYRGHHPGRDNYDVVWPPERRRLRHIGRHVPDGRNANLSLIFEWYDDKQPPPRTSHSANFTDYIHATAYRNIATRMLGGNTQAYDIRDRKGGGVVNDTVFARAKAVLHRVPFVLLEEGRGSYLLFAYTFTRTRDRCLQLYASFEPLITGGSRRHSAFTSLRRLKEKEPWTDPSTAIQQNETLKATFESLNEYDVALYQAAKEIWCSHWLAAARDEGTCVSSLAEKIFPVYAMPDFCRGHDRLATVDDQWQTEYSEITLEASLRNRLRLSPAS